MTRLLNLAGAVGFLVCLASTASGESSRAKMEESLNLLKTALTACEEPSAKQIPKEQIASVLTAAKKCARESFDGHWQGRRGKAMECMDEAISAIKDGDKTKCASQIRKAVALVRECIQRARS